MTNPDGPWPNFAPKSPAELGEAPKVPDNVAGNPTAEREFFASRAFHSALPEKWRREDAENAKVNYTDRWIIVIIMGTLLTVAIVTPILLWHFEVADDGTWLPHW